MNMSIDVKPTPTTLGRLVVIGHKAAASSGQLLMTAFHDKTVWLMTGILVIGTSLRIWMALYERVNLDEGVYLNDAKLILEGLTPFKDFITREPLHFYTLAGFLKVFGLSVFAGRLMMVVAAPILMLLAYWVGTYFYGRKVGLLAAIIYGLAPYIVYQGSVVAAMEVYESGLVLLSLFFLVRAANEGGTRWLLLSGLTLGLAILFKRGAAVFLPIELVGLIFMLNWTRCQRALWWLLGFTIGMIPLIYFISVTNVTWMWNVLGLGGDFYPASSQAFVLKRHLVFSATVVLLYLFAPAFLFLRSALKDSGYGPFTGWGVFLLLLFFLFMVSSGTVLNKSAFGAFGMPDSAEVNFKILLGVTVAALLLNFSSRLTIHERQPLGTLMLLSCLGGYIFLFANYPRLFVHHFMEMGLVLSIMAAAVLVALFRTPVQLKPSDPPFVPLFLRDAWSSWRPAMRYLLPTVFVVCLVVSAIFTAVFAYSGVNRYNRVSEPVPMADRSLPWVPNNFYQRAYSNNMLSRVSSFLQENTAESEEIYTEEKIFVVLANRHVPYNISYPHQYLHTPEDDPVPRDPFNVVPSVTEIIDRLEKTGVKYVVEGELTRRMFAIHPNLGAYVQAHYTLDRTFGDDAATDRVRIYRRTTYPLKFSSAAVSNSELPSGAIVVSGSWAEKDGVLTSTFKGKVRGILLMDIEGPGKPFTIEASLKVEGEGGIAFGYEDRENHYLFRMIKSRLHGVAVVQRRHGKETVIAQKAWNFEQKSWHFVRIVVNGERVIMYVGDERVFDIIVSDAVQRGGIGLIANHGAQFRDIRVRTNLG